MRLTKVQKAILILLRDNDGQAAFTGGPGSRRGITAWPSSYGEGVLIRSYQNPELFLTRRGLLVRIKSDNRPGVWFKLTEAGHEAAAKLAKGQS